MVETLVVDCSVAAKWVLPEPGREVAIRLLERYAAGEVHLIAPDLLLSEFASLVAKRHRRKQMTGEQALRAYALMVESAPELVAVRPRIPLALELAVRHQISLWDAVYVALAVEFGTQLVTADRRLLRGGRTWHPVVRLLE